MRSEGVGHHPGETALIGRKPTGVLIALPLLIAIIGTGAALLSQAPTLRSHHAGSGYGIDDIQTGSIPAAVPAAPGRIDR